MAVTKVKPATEALKKKESGLSAMDIMRKPEERPSVAKEEIPPAALEQPVGADVPEHSHSEIDQILVMLQDLDKRLGDIEMGGEQGMEGEEKPMVGPKMEDIKGLPEIDRGKDKKPIGPKGVSDIPQTTQPAVGKAPGDEDNEWDRLAKGPEADATGKLKKPSSDYTKMPISKNAVQKKEAAPGIVTAGGEDDPTKVKKDAEAPKNPEPMEGAQKQALVAPETPKDDKPKDGEKPAEFGNQEVKESVDRILAGIRREVSHEQKRVSEALTQRQSVVGSAKPGNQQVSEDLGTAKARTNATIKEYLQKSGNTRALSYMARAPNE